MENNKSNAIYDEWKRSGISLKFPTYRNSPMISTRSWFEGKRLDDEAEGLWRIYDNLYDFTTFVAIHPGGSFWLQTTKGTDITEMFETHHVSNIPQVLLKRYKVREAAKPRNYTLTLEENGFYRTLKRRVVEKVKDLDYGPTKKTFIYHLGLLVCTLLLFVISSLNISFAFEPLTALSLIWLSICAHNYFHKRDNWQMYTFNLNMLSFSEFRILHALSHHHYPNSMQDLEMSLFEPFTCWIPNKNFASKATRIVMVLIQPFVALFLIPVSVIPRLIRSIFIKNELYWHDIIGYFVPLLMLTFSTSPPIWVIVQWLRIILMSSFIYGVISINAGHHTPDNYHDGDAVRKDRDWGLYQLDTLTDRSDIKGSQFMVLTHFGDHALHHLFPTLDHGVLPQLYPIFYETLEEFKGELREIPFLDQIIGQVKQILRTEPNPIAPGERHSKNS